MKFYNDQPSNNDSPIPLYNWKFLVVVQQHIKLETDSSWIGNQNNYDETLTDGMMGGQSDLNVQPTS